MKRLCPIALLALAMLATSCEKIIGIPSEQAEKQIVVYAFGTVGSPLTVQLAYSRPIFTTEHYAPGEQWKFDAIEDAEVSLTVNGASPFLLIHQEEGLYTTDYRPREGDHLQLTVNVPGREPATAATVVPGEPQVSNLNAQWSVDPNGFVRFDLTDPSPSGHCYGVRLRYSDTVSLRTYASINDSLLYEEFRPEVTYFGFRYSDLMLEDHAQDDLGQIVEHATSKYTRHLLFADIYINGTSHMVELTVADYMMIPEPRTGITDRTDSTYTVRQTHPRLELEVSGLPADLYNYYRSVWAYQDDALLGLFSEPSQVHSNIQGGIGLFGVSSTITANILTNGNNTRR